MERRKIFKVLKVIFIVIMIISIVGVAVAGILALISPVLVKNLEDEDEYDHYCVDNMEYDLDE